MESCKGFVIIVCFVLVLLSFVSATDLCSNSFEYYKDYLLEQLNNDDLIDEIVEMIKTVEYDNVKIVDEISYNNNLSDSLEADITFASEFKDVNFSNINHYLDLLIDNIDKLGYDNLTLDEVVNQSHDLFSTKLVWSVLKNANVTAVNFNDTWFDLNSNNLINIISSSGIVDNVKNYPKDFNDSFSIEINDECTKNVSYSVDFNGNLIRINATFGGHYVNVNFTFSSNKLDIVFDVNGNFILPVVFNLIKSTNYNNSSEINLISEIDNSTGKAVGNMPNAVSVSVGNIDVFIPATTVASSSASWDGKIIPPTSVEVDLPTKTGYKRSVGVSIKIGSTTSDLTFTNAVKLVLVGETNKEVGFISSDGEFHEINNICGSNTQTYADSLPAGSECYYDDGNDITIWTKHFTEFVTYTETKKSSSSSVCVTKWECSEWGSCVGGVQSRICSYKTGFCTPTTNKPVEFQYCSVPNEEVIIAKNNNSGSENINAGLMTGAVIGGNGLFIWIIVTIIVAIVVLIIILISQNKKVKAQEKSDSIKVERETE